MVTIVSSLVGELFIFDTKKRKELEEQLLFFVNKSSVANEGIFFIITDPFSWPKPAKLEDKDNYLAIITVPVTLLIS